MARAVHRGWMAFWKVDTTVRSSRIQVLVRGVNEQNGEGSPQRLDGLLESRHKTEGCNFFRDPA
jgi:hypothetical protein